MFVVALLSGLALGDESESGPIFDLHVAAVALIGAGIVVGLTFGNTRAMLKSMRSLFIFNRLDGAWLLERVRHPLTREGHFPWGKFNCGQKVLAWLVSISMTLLIFTGVQSWSAGSDSSGPHATFAVVTLGLLAAHIFMAVVNPSTRPALPGMVLGKVRRSWAFTHHEAWLNDVEVDLKTDSHSSFH